MGKSNKNNELNKSEWDVGSVMKELENLGSLQIKKIYMRHGAEEPLFGVTTGNLKLLLKKIKKNHALALELYDTHHYDAMYFAGMIAEPDKMTKQDFEKWMKSAYCYAIADYVVAAALAQSPLGQELADLWLESDQELYVLCAWACYSIMLGYLKDEQFNKDKIQAMLSLVEKTIHNQPDRVRYAMNNFVIATGISYLPLSHEAMRVAKIIGVVEVDMKETQCKVPLASDYIQKAIDKGKLGYKRKKIRS